MGSSSSSSSYCSCFFRHISISLALLLSVVFVFPGSIFSPTFLTFSALILSTAAIFSFTKMKEALKDHFFKKDERLSSENELKNQPEMEVGQKAALENDIIRSEEETHVPKSPELLSNSESFDLLSKAANFDVDRSMPDNLESAEACSDCSVPDDDSLIEIALPDGRYIGAEDDNDKSEGICWPDLPEFWPECMFKQHGLMELLSEINDINEEDNLIEIDLSVGSIKCSRVEIEA